MADKAIHAVGALVLAAVATLVVAGIWGNVTDPRPLARVTRHVPTICSTAPIPPSQHVRGVAYLVQGHGC